MTVFSLFFFGGGGGELQMTFKKIKTACGLDWGKLRRKQYNITIDPYLIENLYTVQPKPFYLRHTQTLPR